MRKKITWMPFVCTLYILSVSGWAQTPVSGKWAKYIDPNRSTSRRGVFEPDQYYLLRTQVPSPKRTWLPAGLQLMRQLDAQYSIVRLAKPAGKGHTGAYRLFPANHYWKLAPSLLQKVENQTAITDTYFVVAVRDTARFRQNLIRLRESVRLIPAYAATGVFTVQCSGQTLLEHLLPLPELIFTDAINRPAREEGVVPDADLSVNAINQVLHTNPQLAGTGVTVSVKDNRYATDDLDFKGRHVSNPLEASSVSQHATNMATLMGGAGNTDSRSRGVAWQSLLTSADFRQLFPDADAYFDTYHVSVQNHSYGTVVENYYGAQAQAYDVHTNRHPAVLHVFSAGNSGTVTDEQGPYKEAAGMANLTGNFKMAKNILTVGSLDTLKTLDPFVSKGPAYDGRVKPELVAYSSSGSSGAAALVSGVGGLLQQAYRETYTGQLPSAALLKAILLTSADEAGVGGPDYLSGYGNLNARRALSTLQKHNYFMGSLRQGEEARFVISLPSQVHALKVTLVWHDAAAPLNSTPALVNDLDMVLEQEASGVRWLPWVLNSYPHPDSLRLPPRRGRDRLNNVEQISLSQPTAGPYTITVSAYDVPEGVQSFYIAYHWEESDEFRWTYPTGSDNMPLHDRRNGIFRWESTFTGQTGQLEYSVNGGQDWVLLERTIDLSRGYYSWPVPDTFAVALARMTVAGKTYLTDPFTLSRPLKTTVGFNCPDSLMLAWNQVAGVAEYVVYSPGEKYLEPIAVTDDTTLVLPKADYPGLHYAVAPRFSSGQLGIRNRTFDYTLQGAECYEASLLSDQRENGIELTLFIGTTYGVEQIDFERREENGFVPIHTLAPVTAVTAAFTDSSARHGLNIYRARLRLSNGQERFTPPDSAYFITDSPFLVFPNPVGMNRELRIYSKTFSALPPRFTLYNVAGQPLLHRTLQTERERIMLPGLPAGLYFYILSAEGQRQTGRLVIQ